MTRPIRVLQLLVTTSPGGGPKHVYDLVRHLPKGEFEFVVGAPRDGIFFERFQALGVPVVEIPFGHIGLRQLFATIRLIRRHAIDLVHTHGKGPGLYGRLAARWTGVPAVHTFHGIHYQGYPVVAQWLYLALERWLSRISRLIINVSGSQEGEGLRLRLFRAEQSVVIVNGVDFEEMDTVLRASTIHRGTFGLGSDDLVLGCVARFDPVKRLEVLLGAVRRLRDRIPKLALILVGGGGEEERIRNLAKTMGVAQQVIFTGFLEDPTPIYPVLDLYLSASLKEGLPLAVVEAMGAGVPVIATDVPGHRDVVTAGKTGILIPVDNVPALAAAVMDLWSDPARRAATGEAARQWARGEFHIRKMVGRTAGVYRALGRSTQ